ncbi:MAG: SRPBCC domain-containing protein [Polyangiaceae bacterium]
MSQPQRITLTKIFPAPPGAVYSAWLDGASHSAMTGSPATGQARVGHPFTAWDGYIAGLNLELVRDKRIIQSWRSADFTTVDLDSRLEVHLEPVARGSKLTLIHADLPPGQARKYADAWVQFYFEPMTSYFTKVAKALRTGGPMPKFVPPPRQVRSGFRRPTPRAGGQEVRAWRAGSKASLPKAAPSKPAASKPAPKAMPSKPAPKAAPSKTSVVAKPVAKPVAKKAVAKPVAKKAVAKPVAKKAAKPAAKKSAAKPVAKKAASKPVAKKAAKPAAKKPAAKPAAKKPAAKPAAKKPAAKKK